MNNQPGYANGYAVGNEHRMGLEREVAALRITNAVLDARVKVVQGNCDVWFSHMNKAQDALAAEREKVAALQARVDALMLEYCPAEMTQAQRDNWAAYQVASTPSDTAELRSALSNESVVPVSVAPTLAEQLTTEREARAGLERSLRNIRDFRNSAFKTYEQDVDQMKHIAKIALEVKYG